MIELDEDENIIAETQKDKLSYVFCWFMVILVLLGALITNSLLILISAVFIEVIFIYYIYKFLCSKFFLTNKRIIYISGSVIKYIKIEEIKYWRAVSNAILIKTIDNQSFSVIGIKNFNEFTKYLNDNSYVKMDEKFNYLMWIAVILGVIISQVISLFKY